MTRLVLTSTPIGHVLQLAHAGSWPLLEGVIDRIPPVAWLQLARETPLWLDFTIPGLEARLRTLGFAAAALASLNPNGFVREVATDRLAEVTTGRELSWLMIRTSDWVPVVSGKASRAVASRIANLPASRVCEIAVLALALAAGDRFKSQAAWLPDLLARLRDPDVLPYAEAVLRGADRAAQELLFEPLAAALPEALVPCLRDFARGRDPWLALRSLRALSDRGWVDADLLVAMRRAGLRALGPAVLDAAAKHTPDLARRWAREDIFSSRRSTRELARHLLRDEGADWAAVYREEIARLGVSAALASALAEVGTESDLHTFRTWLDHPLSDVRAAGVFGTGRVAGAAGRTIYECAMGDSASRVRDTAQRFIRLHLGRAYANYGRRS